MPIKPVLPDPDWGYSAPVGAIVEPPGGLRSVGWTPNDPHPAQFQNWLDNNYSQWVTWLRNSYPDVYYQDWAAMLGSSAKAVGQNNLDTPRVQLGVNANPVVYITPISVPRGYTINSYGCILTTPAVRNIEMRLLRFRNVLTFNTYSSHSFPAVPAGDPVDVQVTAVEDPVGLPHVVDGAGGVYVIETRYLTNTTANDYIYNVYCELEPTS